MQLIWYLLQLMGHINLLMDENKCKIDPANRMKFSNSCIIVVRMIKNSWNLVLYLQIFPNLVANDYKSHLVINGLVTFWLISTSGCTCSFIAFI